MTLRIAMGLCGGHTPRCCHVAATMEGGARPRSYLDHCDGWPRMRCGWPRGRRLSRNNTEMTEPAICVPGGSGLMLPLFDAEQSLHQLHSERSSRNSYTLALQCVLLLSYRI